VPWLSLLDDVEWSGKRPGVNTSVRRRWDRAAYGDSAADLAVRVHAVADGWRYWIWMVWGRPSV